jgi:hypothetical protein
MGNLPLHRPAHSRKSANRDRAPTTLTLAGPLVPSGLSRPRGQTCFGAADGAVGQRQRAAAVDSATGAARGAARTLDPGWQSRRANGEQTRGDRDTAPACRAGWNSLASAEQPYENQAWQGSKKWWPGAALSVRAPVEGRADVGSRGREAAGGGPPSRGLRRAAPPGRGPDLRAEVEGLLAHDLGPTAEAGDGGLLKRPPRAEDFGLGAYVEKTDARSRPMSHCAFGRGTSAARRAWERRRSGSVSHSRSAVSPELETRVLPSGLKAGAYT